MSFSEWKEVSLKEAIEFNPRETLKKGTIAKKIGMDKLGTFQRRIEGFELSSFSGGTKFRNGDTLLARITPCLENGKTAQVTLLDDDEIAFGSTEYIVLREKSGKSINDFIFYLAISPYLRDIAIKSMTGTSGRQRAQKDVIENTKIKLPPLHEQKAIAHILSTLDDKIEVNNQINKTLENMAQAIFKQWFVDFEFPNEDGEPYKSSGGEMVESELGMIPKGWEVVHLKDKLNFERGIEPGSKNYSKTYFERSIPFYRVGDMLGVAENYVDKNLINDKTLKTRDVAVSFDGTVGRVVTGLRGSYSTGIRKIYAKKGEYFPNCFIYFLFKTEFIQSTIMQYATGTTILHASESIEYLAIPYHEEIIKKFVPIIEAIFNTIVNKKKENESLSNTRDILLPKLMSGEIRVPLDEEGDAS